MSKIDPRRFRHVFTQSTLERLQKRPDLCADLLPEMLGELALELETTFGPSASLPSTKRLMTSKKLAM